MSMSSSAISSTASRATRTQRTTRHSTSSTSRPRTCSRSPRQAAPWSTRARSSVRDSSPRPDPMPEWLALATSTSTSREFERTGLQHAHSTGPKHGPRLGATWPSLRGQGSGGAGRSSWDPISMSPTLWGAEAIEREVPARPFPNLSRCRDHHNRVRPLDRRSEALDQNQRGAAPRSCPRLSRLPQRAHHARPGHDAQPARCRVETKRRMKHERRDQSDGGCRAQLRHRDP